MQYKKPALSFEQQADLIISRGLKSDRDVLIGVLKNVNYYRLSGYLYPFRNADDTYREGTTFDQVWCHYTFDRRLRLIVLDAIERFEVSAKTRLVNLISKEKGPFGYAAHVSFPNLSTEDFDSMLSNITRDASRSKETFVKHFNLKYGDEHKHLPLWMMSEIITFGTMITMFKGLENKLKSGIADFYGISQDILESWLVTINVIRNICAHHGRLWNREMGVKPLIPRNNKYPKWHAPVRINNNRIFGILTILRYLLKISAPKTKWKERLISLLNEYPGIDKKNMGFPENWNEPLIWKS